MIDIGIDQFTLILQASEAIDVEDWYSYKAEQIIRRFIHLSNMKDVFSGYGFAECKLPEGYSTGFSFCEEVFYFCIAYHEYFMKMGVIVKFSGHAWSEYQKRYKKKYGIDINLHTFLKKTDSNLYTQRLSRVDTFVDYIDENIDISSLKRSLENGKIEIRYGKFDTFDTESRVSILDKVVSENKKKEYRRNYSSISEISKNFFTETLYIGSKSRNNNILLRIYDKKKEQTQ